MNHPESFPPPFYLHQWLIQPDLNRISGSDGPVQIEPRVMAVLLALAAQPGELVSRLDLLDQVWSDTVVGEEILTRAISELRRVFGDSARQPVYIETIRNNGYRLIAPVTAPEPEAIPANAPVEIIPSVPTDSPSPKIHEPLATPFGFRWSTLVLVVVAVTLLGSGFRYLNREAGFVDTPTPEAVPLTAFAGREYHPSLSADGTRMVFAWSGTTGGKTAIYLKQRNSETLLQLSDQPGWASWPAWSPDGQTIAFVQTVASGSHICLVPSLGGVVRHVHEVTHLVEGLDWSPDGTQLVFSARDSLSGGHRLLLLDLATLNTELVPLKRPDNAGDFQPRFSPDGQQLAWIGHDRAGEQGVYVVPVEGGEAKALQLGQDNLQGLAWSVNGQTLVFAAAPAGIYGLWQVPVGGGEARKIPTPGEFAWNPTIARQSGDLVYEQVRVDQDLWQVNLQPGEPAVALITSTRWEFGADYHPDGTQVAFVSARGGNPEIWLGDANGQNLRKLTNLGASSVGNLRWSPAGEKLACNAVVGGEHQVLVADPAGGVPQQVTTGYSREVFVAWSAPGDALLLGADAGQGREIYRLSLRSGDSRQITRGGGLSAQEAGDGRTLYFTRPDRPGLWRRQSGGRVEAELILPELQARDRFNWLLRDDKIIWVMRAGDTAMLLEHDLGRGRSVFLAELPGFQGTGLAVAPSDSTFIYPKMGEAAGDLMLIAGWGAEK